MSRVAVILSEAKRRELEGLPRLRIETREIRRQGCQSLVHNPHPNLHKRSTPDQGITRSRIGQRVFQQPAR